MEKEKFKSVKILIGGLIAADLIVWALIVFPQQTNNLQLYFLDVGQGDSSLAMLPGGIKILIDGGSPNGKLQANLEKILPVNDRYIDLVMISHPQLDHFGGFVELLKNYKVGAVLTSDQVSQQSAWQELERVIKDKGIVRIILASGDTIRHQNSRIDILSPEVREWAKDVNDLSIVALLESASIKIFFGGDISGGKEKELTEKYNLDVDVLKVSHHGSRFSSEILFVKEASPLVSVIGVGKNSYGHPTPQVLSRLASVGSQIFRTDENGLIKLLVDGGKIKMYASK